MLSIWRLHKMAHGLWLWTIYAQCVNLNAISFVVCIIVTVMENGNREFCDGIFRHSAHSNAGRTFIRSGLSTMNLTEYGVIEPKPKNKIRENTYEMCERWGKQNYDYAN